MTQQEASEHYNILAPQGVIRLLFKAVVQQFDKLSAGDRIRHKPASLRNADNNSTLLFDCQ